MKAFIAIGVNRVDGVPLPVLRGAASGAEQFREWAHNEGFNAWSITDASEPVTVKSVRDRITSIVQARNCTQLIIYFAGHGVLKAADTEMWLLSDAASDANAAVNVAGSIRLGRNCGIPHLVFISDACRSLAADQRLSEITGSIVFPIEAVPRRRPEVDIFYATLPGDVAWELPAQDAAEHYDGILTQCMLEGLRGPEPSLVETVQAEDGADLFVVSSRTLKPWLEDKIPATASRRDNRLTQIPDVRVESQRPKHLAVVDPPLVPDVLVWPPSPQISEVLPSTRKPQRPADASSAGASQPPKRRRLTPRRFLNEIGNSLEGSRLREFTRDANELLAEQVAPSTEHVTGFILGGAERALITFRGADDGSGQISNEVVLQDKQWVIDVPSTIDARSALIRFATDSGTCLATIPGYIGDVVIEDGRVARVNYTPSQHGGRFVDFEMHREEIEERRAMATAAAKGGYFRVAPRKAKTFANKLRKFKFLDPSLGIYSAYAYAQSGMVDEVVSIFDWMARDQVIPFDVALLAGKLDRAQLRSGRIAPVCPMLTQGWSLMDDSVPVSPAVRAAARHLKPALWTTLTEKGVEILSTEI